MVRLPLSSNVFDCNVVSDYCRKAPCETVAQLFWHLEGEVHKPRTIAQLNGFPAISLDFCHFDSDFNCNFLIGWLGIHRLLTSAALSDLSQI